MRRSLRAGPGRWSQVLFRGAKKGGEKRPVDGGQRRIWVNRVVLTPRPSLPVYPDERTFSVSVGMSQRCQKRHCMILAMVLSNPRPLDVYFTPIIDIDPIYVAHDTGEFVDVTRRRRWLPLCGHYTGMPIRFPSSAPPRAPCIRQTR